MFANFIEKIKALFGREDNSGMQSKIEQPTGMGSQIFRGHLREIPDFAKGVDASAMIDVCKQHVVCEYTPHIEQQRIYSTKRGFDGNLETEYEGIAANCGAIKNFGMAVAKEQGYLKAYRYVDLNHILACCCGKPRRCVFYLEARGEQSAVDRQLKKLPSQEEEERQAAASRG